MDATWMTWAAAVLIACSVVTLAALAVLSARGRRD